MTSSSAFTLEKTTTIREPTSSKGGAKKDQKGQTEGKGRPRFMKIRGPQYMFISESF